MPIHTSRYRRLQSAMIGKPVEKMSREELEDVAQLARLEVEGTGKDGYVTMDDLRSAVAGAARPVVHPRRAPAADAADSDEPEAGASAALNTEEG